MLSKAEQNTEPELTERRREFPRNSYPPIVRVCNLQAQNEAQSRVEPGTAWKTFEDAEKPGPDDTAELKRRNLAIETFD